MVYIVLLSIFLLALGVLGFGAINLGMEPKSGLQVWTKGRHGSSYRAF